MKSKRSTLASVLSISLIIFVFLSHAVSAQLSGQIRPLRPGLLQRATEPNDDQPRVRRSLGESLAERRNGVQSIEPAEHKNAPGLIDGTRHLIHRDPTSAGSIQPEAQQNTIPFWSDSFTYQGLTYTYRMVGTDPKDGAKTTVIPTVIIPLRFVFPDGQVFDAGTDLVDGQTAIQGIVNSPIFKDYNFVINGTNVGRTQIGDAFQRANFWDSVSNRARNYHVLLGQPTVLPTQTIVVPDGLGHYETDFSTGLPYPVVDLSFFEGQTDSILTAANVAPTQLPIVVWGNVVAGFAFGFHGVTSINNGPLQTHIGTSYKSQNFFAGSSPDVSSLSHEIIEWLDDPFTNNFVPGWNYAFLSDSEQCDSGRIASDLLETCDPVQNFDESVVALPGGAFTYHVVEGMFIDFYTRANHSRSVNGQYSMFEIGAQYGIATEPSTPCTGHVELNDVQYFYIGGSNLTRASGINNNGAITGIYRDSTGSFHGYLLTPTSFQRIDHPGATDTFAYQINDSGIVVGEYLDAAGGDHGYLFKDGQFSEINFPNAIATLATDINRAGDIVGAYVDTNFHTRGFLLRRGVFSSIDTPFKRVTLATGINSNDDIVGFSSIGDEINSGFLRRGRNSSPIAFPGAASTEPYDITDSNAMTGLFTNADGYFDGFVTIGGFFYEVHGFSFGLNGQGQIVGSRSFGGITYAMVGTLPGFQNSASSFVSNPQRDIPSQQNRSAREVVLMNVKQPD